MANEFKSGIARSPRSTKIWRIVQFLVWIVGLLLLFFLFFLPKLGVLLFWNVLIPIAPALFVVATGIVLLYILVPLRHPVLNTNGPATGWLVIGLTSIGFLLSLKYEWKSAWCSGLCPIHSVEKLYGSNVGITIPNAHCEQCRNCVIPCPDSTQHNQHNPENKITLHAVSSTLLTGGLPGFIWGWFHVPDAAFVAGWQEILASYLNPLIGLFISLTIFMLWKKWAAQQLQNLIIPIFATVAVSCYYWFRIPALLGFGNYGKDGLLIDLSSHLPTWSPLFLSIGCSLFFGYWILLRRKKGNSWTIRPPFA